MDDTRPTTSRRNFLGLAGAAGATLATAGVVAGCSDDGGSGESSSAGDGASGVRYEFRSDRQAGVTAPLAAAGIVAGLDLRVDDKAELRELFADLGDSIEQVMSGEPFEPREGGFPPFDTGILGPDPGATGTTVTVGVGNSLFDDRFGLGSLKPVELQRMPKFGNDFLVREERAHGDLSITVSADTQDAAVHGFRQVLRATRGRLVPKWMRQGYNDIFPDVGPGEAPVRNLMGFKDGTSNPSGDDDSTMEELVWVQPEDEQPDWAVGGTYQAIRVIRMQVEFWDRTRLNEQEAIFGRSRDTGAPLGMEDETDTPVFTDLESHIARANPRTPGSERNIILRRGFNYSDGLDGNDQLDQGLLFISYQRSLEDGFITVQRRLDGEVLEEYIRPVGGGFFYVLPGPGTGDAKLGERLLA
ncbi:MAG: Dyp-type peroxidase [Actinomycetota bacterium]